MKTKNTQRYSQINVRNKQEYNEAIEVNYLAAQALLYTLHIFVKEKLSFRKEVDEKKNTILDLCKII